MLQKTRAQTKKQRSGPTNLKFPSGILNTTSRNSFPSEKFATTSRKKFPKEKFTTTSRSKNALTLTT